jgi:hypothetical protein
MQSVLILLEEVVRWKNLWNSGSHITQSGSCEPRLRLPLGFGYRVRIIWSLLWTTNSAHKIVLAALPFACIQKWGPVTISLHCCQYSSFLRSFCKFATFSSVLSRYLTSISLNQILGVGVVYVIFLLGRACDELFKCIVGVKCQQRKWPVSQATKRVRG